MTWLRTIFTSALLLAVPALARGEEIRLHDNSRLHGLIQGISDSGALWVLEPSGQQRHVPLEEAVVIRFLGRAPLLVQSGTQEFRMLDGSRLRGQILRSEGDLVWVATAAAGEVPIDLAHVGGFVSLPLIGFSGRKAEELIDSPSGNRSANLDVVLDRRGSTYAGVLRRLDRTQIDLDHEDLLQVVPVRVLYVAGVRLADASRQGPSPWDGSVRLRLRTRDGSQIFAVLRRVHLGRWEVVPAWDPTSTLSIDVEEIDQVQVLGGRVQYLSQLRPVEIEEKTVLSPRQPYRLDRSSQGDALSIAGKRYPWGIGVHANSSLTFDVGGRFQQFHAEVGIASRIVNRGSVVFAVYGDGRPLFESGVVTGSAAAPLPVSVDIDNVKRLTLKVTDAGDLDLGDVANWGSARVTR